MKSFDIDLLIRALREYSVREFAAIDALPTAVNVNSDEIKKNVYNKYEASKKTNKHLSSKALIAIVIAAALILATAFTVVAYKEKWFLFREERTSVSTNFDIPEGENLNSELKEIFLPNYLPQGYSLKSSNASIAGIVTYWTNEKSTIILDQNPIGTFSSSIDTEEDSYTEAVLGGQPLYYVIRHNKLTAIWHTDDYVYIFSAPADLGLEEIGKIISSISFYEEFKE